MNSRFNELWDEFNIELRKYIQSKVRHKQDTEDILQDVFIKIYKNIDGLKDVSSVKSWVYRITKNTIIDFYKKRRDISVEPETLNFIQEDTEETSNMNEEISRCLEKMLFELPPKYKEVYELYEKKNFKHKEIVTKLDISMSASKVRLKRARDMFREKLIDCCHFQVDKYGNIIEYTRKKDMKPC